MVFGVALQVEVLGRIDHEEGAIAVTVVVMAALRLHCAELFGRGFEDAVSEIT